MKKRRRSKWRNPLFSARLPAGAEPRQCVRLLLLPRSAVVAYVFAAVFGTAAVLLCWAGMPGTALIYLLTVLLMLLAWWMGGSPSVSLPL